MFLNPSAAFWRTHKVILIVVFFLVLFAAGIFPHFVYAQDTGFVPAGASTEVDSGEKSDDTAKQGEEGTDSKAEGCTTSKIKEMKGRVASNPNDSAAQSFLNDCQEKQGSVTWTDTDGNIYTCGKTPGVLDLCTQDNLIDADFQSSYGRTVISENGQSRVVKEGELKPEIQNYDQLYKAFDDPEANQTKIPENQLTEQQESVADKIERLAGNKKDDFVGGDTGFLSKDELARQEAIGKEATSKYEEFLKRQSLYDNLFGESPYDYPSFQPSTFSGVGQDTGVPTYQSLQPAVTTQSSPLPTSGFGDVGAGNVSPLPISQTPSSLTTTGGQPLGPSGFQSLTSGPQGPYSGLNQEFFGGGVTPPIVSGPELTTVIGPNGEIYNINPDGTITPGSLVDIGLSTSPALQPFQAIGSDGRIISNFDPFAEGLEEIAGQGGPVIDTGTIQDIANGTPNADLLELGTGFSADEIRQLPDDVLTAAQIALIDPTLGPAEAQRIIGQGLLSNSEDRDQSRFKEIFDGASDFTKSIANDTRKWLDRTFGFDDPFTEDDNLTADGSSTNETDIRRSIAGAELESKIETDTALVQEYEKNLPPPDSTGIDSGTVPEEITAARNRIEQNSALVRQLQAGELDKDNLANENIPTDPSQLSLDKQTSFGSMGVDDRSGLPMVRWDLGPKPDGEKTLGERFSEASGDYLRGALGIGPAEAKKYEVPPEKLGGIFRDAPALACTGKSTCYVTPELLAAQVRHEQAGANPRAVGGAGEIGMAQIKPGTANLYKARYEQVTGEKYDPHGATGAEDAARQSVTMQAIIMQDLSEKGGGVREGLGTYNTGKFGTTRGASYADTVLSKGAYVAKGEASPTGNSGQFPPRGADKTYWDKVAVRTIGGPSDPKITRASVEVSLPDASVAPTVNSGASRSESEADDFIAAKYEQAYNARAGEIRGKGYSSEEFDRRDLVLRHEALGEAVKAAKDAGYGDTGAVIQSEAFLKPADSPGDRLRSAGQALIDAGRPQQAANLEAAVNLTARVQQQLPDSPEKIRAIAARLEGNSLDDYYSGKLPAKYYAEDTAGRRSGIPPEYIENAKRLVEGKPIDLNVVPQKDLNLLRAQIAQPGGENFYAEQLRESGYDDGQIEGIFQTARTGRSPDVLTPGSYNGPPLAKVDGSTNPFKRVTDVLRGESSVTTYYDDPSDVSEVPQRNALIVSPQDPATYNGVQVAAPNGIKEGLDTEVRYFYDGNDGSGKTRYEDWVKQQAAENPNKNLVLVKVPVNDSSVPQVGVAGIRQAVADFGAKATGDPSFGQSLNKVPVDVDAFSGGVNPATRHLSQIGDVRSVNISDGLKGSDRTVLNNFMKGNKDVPVLVTHTGATEGQATGFGADAKKLGFTNVSVSSCPSGHEACLPWTTSRTPSAKTSAPTSPAASERQSVVNIDPSLSGKAAQLNNTVREFGREFNSSPFVVRDPVTGEDYSPAEARALSPEIQARLQAAGLEYDDYAGEYYAPDKDDTDTWKSWEGYQKEYADNLQQSAQTLSRLDAQKQEIVKSQIQAGALPKDFDYTQANVARMASAGIPRPIGYDPCGGDAICSNPKPWTGMATEADIGNYVRENRLPENTLETYKDWVVTPQNDPSKVFEAPSERFVVSDKEGAATEFNQITEKRNYTTEAAPAGRAVESAVSEGLVDKSAEVRYGNYVSADGKGQTGFYVKETDGAGRALAVDVAKGGVPSGQDMRDIAGTVIDEAGGRGAFGKVWRHDSEGNVYDHNGRLVGGFKMNPIDAAKSRASGGYYNKVASDTVILNEVMRRAGGKDIPFTSGFRPSNIGSTRHHAQSSGQNGLRGNNQDFTYALDYHSESSSSVAKNGIVELASRSQWAINDNLGAKVVQLSTGASYNGIRNMVHIDTDRRPVSRAYHIGAAGGDLGSSYQTLSRGAYVSQESFETALQNAGFEGGAPKAQLVDIGSGQYIGSSVPVSGTFSELIVRDSSGVSGNISNDIDLVANASPIIGRAQLILVTPKPVGRYEINPTTQRVTYTPPAPGPGRFAPRPPSGPPTPPDFFRNVAAGVQDLLGKLAGALGGGGSGGGSGGGQSQPQQQPQQPSPPVQPPVATQTPRLACAESVALVEGHGTTTVRWACSSGSTSRGIGFETKGTASGQIAFAVTETNQNVTKFNAGIECLQNGSIIGTRSCEVEIVRPILNLIANPSRVKLGETAQIIWSSVGTKKTDSSCLVYASNGAITRGGPTGTVDTLALTRNTEFAVTCDVNGGDPITSKLIVDVVGDGGLPIRAVLPQGNSSTQTQSEPSELQFDDEGTIQQTEEPRSDTFTGTDAQGNEVQLCDPNIGITRFTWCLLNNR